MASAALLVAFRAAVVEALARHVLAGRGFPEAAVGAVEVGLRRTVLAPVRLGPGLAAERVRLEYDLRRLPRSPLAAVRIDGLLVDLESPGSVARGAGGEDGASIAVPAGAPEVEVTDAVVRVPSPRGVVSVRGSARIEPGPGGSARIASRGTVEATGGSARFAVDLGTDGERLSGTVGVEHASVKRPGLAFRDASLRLRVAAGRDAEGRLAVDSTTAGAGLRLDEPPLEVSGIDVRLAAGNGVVAEVRVERIEDRADPPRFAPLALAGRGELREGAGAVRGEISAAGGAARAAFAAAHDVASGRGSGSLDLARLAFAPGKLQPADLVPRLSFVERVSGSLGVAVRARWSAGAPAASATLRPEKLSFTVGGVRVDSLGGDVALASVFPPVTRAEQELRARRIRFGVELDDPRLRYSLAKGAGDAPAVRIRRGEAAFAGGRLLLEDERFDPGAAENRLRLRVDGVDLGRLADALGADGIEASGAVNGEIPLRFSGAGVAVEAGRLDGTGPGVVKVAAETARRVLPQRQESLDLLLRALENFHYEALSISLDKEAEGSSAIRVALDGRNPDLGERRPFRIRVNVAANLDEILGPVVGALRLTDRTLREIVRGLR